MISMRLYKYADRLTLGTSHMEKSRHPLILLHWYTHGHQPRGNRGKGGWTLFEQTVSS